MPEAIITDGERDIDKSGCCCCFRKKMKKEAVVSKTNNEANSTMPFTAELPKDLVVGRTICINAITLPQCARYSVNLICGRAAVADIAFHLNPRFNQRYVVRNSRLNGQWGEEETTMPLKFPFVRNKKFELNIFIAKGEFFVSLDGVHLFAYTFRVPLSKITTMEVHGAVEVYGIEFKQLDKYPEDILENGAITVAVGRGDDDETAETATETPVTFLLPQGFQPDWQLEIYGRVKILPHSFYINLQEGSHLWPHPVIPLHLNPRFIVGQGEPVFVRNSWINGKWGQEERAPGFQFTPSEPFTLVIRRGTEHFSVWVNAKLVGEFKFRGDVDNIDALYIQGDVEVLKVILDDKSTNNFPLL